MTSPAEYEFAKASLFERHPAMKYWPIGMQNEYEIGNTIISFVFIYNRSQLVHWKDRYKFNTCFGFLWRYKTC